MRGGRIEVAERTERLLAERAVCPRQVRNRRLARNVAAIQRVAEKLTEGLLLRDPLSEKVHASKAGFILTAAGLGFLGLGAQPPTPEGGAMVSSGRDVILDQWWVATIPGLAIFIVSLGFNLLGDGLRDVFDPKSGS